MNSVDNLISIGVFLLFTWISIDYYYDHESHTNIQYIPHNTNKVNKLNINLDYDPDLSNLVIQASLSNPTIRSYEDEYYDVEYLYGEYYLVRREDYDEDWDHYLDGPEIKIYPYNNYSPLYDPCIIHY